MEQRISKIRAALEILAFEPFRDGYNYSPDIRVAALAALINLEKLERKNEKTCNCPDGAPNHIHDFDNSITNRCHCSGSGPNDEEDEGTEADERTKADEAWTKHANPHCGCDE